MLFDLSVVMANSSNLAFCLEYSNHKTDMLDAFDDYLRNESMVDVMLSCEGNTIKAHKMVLSAGSTYFRNIFAAFKNPFQFPVLIIKDMPFRDLKAIVEFLYRGEVVVPVEQVSSLSKSAQTLFIKGLEKYFNKSAVVNVAKSSTNQSTKSNALSNSEDNIKRTQNVSKFSKRVKQKTNDSNRSIGMSLRNTRRQDYRQLSNGDFSSDEDNSKSEFQTNPFDSIESLNQTNTSHRRRQSGLLSRRIKLEKMNMVHKNIDNSTTNDPKTVSYEKVQNSGDDHSLIDEEYNQSDNNSENDFQQINHLDSDYIDTQTHPPEDEDNCRATTSTKSIKHPIRTTLGKSVDNSSKKSNKSLRPIKGDPDKMDKMDLIHCSHCPRVFSQTSSLNIHLKRIHSDQNKEHMCQLCGKRYSWRSGLYKHMRTHRN